MHLRPLCSVWGAVCVWGGGRGLGRGGSEGGEGHVCVGGGRKKTVHGEKCNATEAVLHTLPPHTCSSAARSATSSACSVASSSSHFAFPHFAPPHLLQCRQKCDLFGLLRGQEPPQLRLLLRIIHAQADKAPAIMCEKLVGSWLKV